MEVVPLGIYFYVASTLSIHFSTFIFLFCFKILQAFLRVWEEVKKAEDCLLSEVTS